MGISDKLQNHGADYHLKMYSCGTGLRAQWAGACFACSLIRVNLQHHLGSLITAFLRAQSEVTPKHGWAWPQNLNNKNNT